jgi:hypothetical protein
MTNEQLALLLRGYQFRVRHLRRIADKTDTVPARELIRKELEEFDNDLGQHIHELLGLMMK